MCVLLGYWVCAGFTCWCLAFVAVVVEGAAELVGGHDCASHAWCCFGSPFDVGGDFDDVSGLDRFLVRFVVDPNRFTGDVIVEVPDLAVPSGDGVSGYGLWLPLRGEGLIFFD